MKLSEMNNDVCIKHKENIYNVLAIVNDKTVEEIRKQNPVQTIKQLKELWSDKELLNF